MGVFRFALTIIIVSLITTPSFSGEARSPSSAEWEKTVEAAKKEGKLVAALPASAELRKAIGEIFPKRYPGIELDLTNARGPSNANKIAAEHAAGVRYFDLLISGTATPFSLLECRHPGAGGTAAAFARSQRSQALVRRPYLARQRQTIYLCVPGLSVGKYLA